MLALGRCPLIIADTALILVEISVITQGVCRLPYVIVRTTLSVNLILAFIKVPLGLRRILILSKFRSPERRYTHYTHH